MLLLGNDHRLAEAVHFTGNVALRIVWRSGPDSLAVQCLERNMETFKFKCAQEVMIERRSRWRSMYQIGNSTASIDKIQAFLPYRPFSAGCLLFTFKMVCKSVVICEKVMLSLIPHILKRRAAAASMKRQ